MAPVIEKSSNLKDPKVQAVLNATTIESRDDKALDKVELALPPLVGLGNNYRLAFTLDPSSSRWVTAATKENGDVVSGYIKDRNAKPGEGKIASFTIPLSKVDANGTIHEIIVDGMKIQDPAKNTALMQNLVRMGQQDLTPKYEGGNGSQKAISYVGALPDGSVIALREQNPGAYRSEAAQRSVEVTFLKGGSYGHYTAQVANFPATDKENQSEKRSLKVFDGSGNEVGNLTVNFALVPLVRDRGFIEAVGASKEGRGKDVDRDLGRLASDGRLVSVSFTRPDGSSPQTIKDLKK